MPLRLVPSIHRATHAIALILDQSRDIRVSQGEAHVLAHLVSEGTSTVAEIHRAFGHKRSTLTSILDRLEARHLITREVNADDRRSFVVALTRQGRSLAAKVYARLEAVEIDIGRQFSRAETETCERVMGSVADLAEREKPGAHAAKRTSRPR